MTLSETEAELACLDHELKTLRDRRALLQLHRMRLAGGGDADANGWPAAEEEEADWDAAPEPAPRLQARANDGAPLPEADLKRWGAAFPWSREVDRLKKEYAHAHMPAHRPPTE